MQAGDTEDNTAQYTSSHITQPLMSDFDKVTSEGSASEKAFWRHCGMLFDLYLHTKYKWFKCFRAINSSFKHSISGPGQFSDCVLFVSIVPCSDPVFVSKASKLQGLYQYSYFSLHANNGELEQKPIQDPGNFLQSSKDFGASL